MPHLDGDTIVDQPEGRRENYVPLHTMDVVDFLAQHPQLSSDEVSRFREVASLILSLLHHLYRQHHEQLLYTYAPLDPDRDRLLRSVPTTKKRDQLATELFRLTAEALLRANYHKLNDEDIQHALEAASRWGVRMRVDFDSLDQLDVYARGYVIGQREYRNWRNWFRLETVRVPLFQRIVVIFRISGESLSDQFDSRRIYLRMFKNVPQEDVDMMLPATGIHMTWLDHSRIVVPSLYAAAITLWRFLRNVVLLALFGVFKTIALIVLVVFAIGFGVKSMFTYRSNTKRRYMLSMTQSLYYQNLDNNAGVLLRLLEEGEQQEACEAILAYFVTAVLLKNRAPATLDEIDDACEQILMEATGLNVDFDVESTAKVLAHLGILRAESSGWRALDIEPAFQQLDRTWDSWYS